MKINLRKELSSLNGEALKDGTETLTLGKALSNILSTSEEGGKMKLFILAKKFYEDKEVDLDAADLAIVKKAVEKTKIYTPLVAGQVELLLAEVKEEKKK